MRFFKAKRQEAFLEASQEEEASAPHFESLKRPGGHVARGLTKLGVQLFWPAAHICSKGNFSDGEKWS